MTRLMPMSSLAQASQSASQVQDELNTYNRAGNAQIMNLSSGPVPSAGSVILDFARTTGRQTRIDCDVKKFRIFR